MARPCPRLRAECANSRACRERRGKAGVRSEEDAFGNVRRARAGTPQPGALVRLRVSVEAGQQFCACWGARHSARNTIKASSRRSPCQHAPQRAADVDGEALRFLDVMSGRVPDGVKLYSRSRRRLRRRRPSNNLPMFKRSRKRKTRSFAGMRRCSASRRQPAAWSSQRMDAPSPLKRQRRRKWS